MDQQRLVNGLRNRDPTAIQELVDLYGTRLLRSASLLCGNETDAQDLVQETFVEAINSAHRFQGRSALYTWLRAILLNLTRHYHRDRNKLIYDDELPDNEPSQSEQEPVRLDLEAAGSALASALAKLSAPHREVLVLRYFEQLKIREIAVQLSISRGTVKSRLHYAIAELQKLLPQEMNLFGAHGTEKQKQ
jgi:RNA polymerase sigma-70 factor (ECF subfamily)